MTAQNTNFTAKQFPEYFIKLEKNYKHNFILLVLDNAFFTFSTSLLSQDTILPAFLNNLTNNAVLIGLIPAIYNLGFFLPQIISSFVVQNLPRRKTYILFIAIMERVAILLIASSTQLINVFSNVFIVTFFIISYALYASTFGMITPAYSDFISKSIYKNRGYYYSINQALSGIIGFVASIFATHILSTSNFPRNFRLLFWVSFAASFISPILIANFKEEPFPIKPVKQNARKFWGRIVKVIRENENLRKYICARQLIGLASMGFSFFGLYSIKSYGLSPSIIGVYTTTIIIAQSLSGILWGFIGDKYGYKYVLVSTTILLVLQGFIALTAHHPSSGLIFSAIIGAVYSATYICHPNLIFEIAPPEETSLFIGLSNSLIAPIISIAPVLGGIIINTLGYTYLFITISAFSLAAFYISTYVFTEPRLITVGKKE